MITTQMGIITYQKKRKKKSNNSRLKVTFLTDSAISGPIPSPGNKVAVIGVEEEQKALATEVEAVELEFAVPRIWLDRFPISRLAKFAAMVMYLFNQRCWNRIIRLLLFCVLGQKCSKTSLSTANVFYSSVKTTRSFQ